MSIDHLADYLRVNPSGAEIRVQTILDGLQIQYEMSVVIGEASIADFVIGSLVFEVDGDYWHGHPRFTNLTDKQLRQQARDRTKDWQVRQCGMEIARLWESDISVDAVISILDKHEAILRVQPACLLPPI